MKGNPPTNTSPHGIMSLGLGPLHYYEINIQSRPKVVSRGGQRAHFWKYMTKVSLAETIINTAPQPSISGLSTTFPPLSLGHHSLLFKFPSYHTVGFCPQDMHIYTKDSCPPFMSKQFNQR